jgi:hypothetical protein
MDKFWDLFQQSVIVQSLVTLILVGTLCYMFATGAAIPDLLAQVTLLVIGFWFGSKASLAAFNSRKVK